MHLRQELGQVRAALEGLETRRLLAAAPATVQMLTGMGPQVWAPELRQLAIAKPQTASELYQPATQLTRSIADAAVAAVADVMAPFHVDRDAMRELLAAAPLEFTPNADENAVVLPLPMPDGSFARFKVVESPIMEPALAAQFPDIKTYRGIGIDDPAASARLDLTPLGFHAQVLSPSGAYYVDPVFRNDAGGTHASYYKRDLMTRESFGSQDVEGDHGEFELSRADTISGDEPPAEITFGTQLRTFRTAVAGNGEYTAFHGGTVSAGQAAIVTTLNRVSGVYEIDLSIRLTLVANNSSLVFTNAGSDPYSNTNASSALTQNQTTCDNVIGSSNYDIGHVFTTGSGGLASLGVVGINGVKARGTTGRSSPVGDAFDIDYVAHEIGHQFGANHTFNSSADGNRNGPTAYEPGSASTIMGYAGIVPNEDLQPNSDPYFHSESIEEIYDHIGSIAAGPSTPTGNTPPTVNAGLDYAIPTGTPFVLTASGSDVNGDSVTYDWQQRDLGDAELLTDADDGNGPLFRTWVPTTSSSRMLPRLAAVLSGTNQTLNASSRPVEKLYAMGRTSSWRVIARDNRPGGGGVTTDDMVLTVVNTGSAFSVTSPNTAVTWGPASTQTVTWNVAGTTGGLINTANVKISLSTDGGNTFPTVLAASTANDGSQSITLPNITSTTARIKVEAIGNIFFDISNVNFTIGTPPPTTISGQVFEDRNANGAIDPGEPGISGVTVFLDTNDDGDLDGGEQSFVTPASGNYSFPGLTAATYHVRQFLPSTHVVVSPAASVAHLSVSGGAVTQNFADFRTTHVGTGSGDDYEVRMAPLVALTTIYSDDFDREFIDDGEWFYDGWFTTGDPGIGIADSDILTLTNDATANPNAGGIVWLTTATSGFGSNFNQTLAANTGALTWSFNLRSNRANLGGLTSGSYGMAYVLGATSDNWSNGGASGYAVVVGQSGGNDPIRLVRFSSGLSSLTQIQSDGSDVETGYYSVKVVYNPTGSTWSLATRFDGNSAFSDPLAGSAYTFTGSPVTDATPIAVPLTDMGARWNYSTAAGQIAQFDNIKLTKAAGGAPSTDSEILIGGVSTHLAPKAMLPSLKFNLGSGDDSLTINYVNGDPIPAGGIFFDGGAGANDAVTIGGAAGVDAVTVTNAFAGPLAGSVNLNDATTGAQTVEGLTFNGGVGNDSLIVASAPVAPITFNGGLTPTDQDSLTLNAGSHTFGGDIGAGTANATLLIANPGTSAVFNASQHLAGMSVNNATATLAANGSRVVNTGTLGIGGTGKLDLKNNDLIVRTGTLGVWNGVNYSGVTGLLKQGLGSGSWTGNGLVTSETAAIAPRGRTTLGIMAAPGTMSFSGESVAAGSVLVKYTYVGDSDLDGVIDGDDYFNIDSGFPSGTGFRNGDFTYSGNIDADDYFWIDANYAFQGPLL